MLSMIQQSAHNTSVQSLHYTSWIAERVRCRRLASRALSLTRFSVLSPTRDHPSPFSKCLHPSEIQYMLKYGGIHYPLSDRPRLALDKISVRLTAAWWDCHAATCQVLTADRGQGPRSTVLEYGVWRTWVWGNFAGSLGHGSGRLDLTYLR
jgi:hypothetical protein